VLVACGCTPWPKNRDSALVLLLLSALLASSVNAISPGEVTALFLFPSWSLHIEEPSQSHTGFNGQESASDGNLKRFLTTNKTPFSSLLGSAPQPVHFTCSCAYVESQSNSANPLGEKLDVNESIRAPLSDTAQLSSPLKRLHLAFGSMKNPDECHLAALPLVRREMEAKHSLSGARPLRATCAPRALQMGGNHFMM